MLGQKSSSPCGSWSYSRAFATAQCYWVTGFGGVYFAAGTISERLPSPSAFFVFLGTEYTSWDLVSDDLFSPCPCFPRFSTCSSPDLFPLPPWMTISLAFPYRFEAAVGSSLGDGGQTMLTIAYLPRLLYPTQAYPRSRNKELLDSLGFHVSSIQHDLVEVPASHISLHQNQQHRFHLTRMVYVPDTSGPAWRE